MFIALWTFFLLAMVECYQKPLQQKQIIENFHIDQHDLGMAQGTQNIQIKTDIQNKTQTKTADTISETLTTKQLEQGNNIIHNTPTKTLVYLHIRLMQQQQPPQSDNKNGQNNNNRDSQKQSQSQSQPQNKSLYLTLLISAIVVVTLLGITFCIVFCIRQIMRNGHFTLNGRATNKVTNLSVNYNYLYPAISYPLFRKQVGIPQCQECVICLEQFQQEVANYNIFNVDKLQIVNMHNETSFGYKQSMKRRISVNKKKKTGDRQYFIDQILINQQLQGISQNGDNINEHEIRNHTVQTKIKAQDISQSRTNSQGLANLNNSHHNRTSYGFGLSHSIHNSIIPQISSVQPPQQQHTHIEVKMTVCGHLLHAKCLDDWLSRQNSNCPLCREQFTVQSIEEWESKLQLNYDENYKKFCEERHKTTKKLERNKESSKISKTKKNQNIQSTLSQIKKSDTRSKSITEQQCKQQQNNNEDPISQNKQTKDQQLFVSCYSPRQQYAIVIYRQIMKYHQKRLLKQYLYPVISGSSHDQNIRNQFSQQHYKQQQRQWQQYGSQKGQQKVQAVQILNININNTDNHLSAHTTPHNSHNNTGNVLKPASYTKVVKYRKCRRTNINNLQQIHNLHDYQDNLHSVPQPQVQISTPQNNNNVLFHDIDDDLQYGMYAVDCKKHVKNMNNDNL